MLKKCGIGALSIAIALFVTGCPLPNGATPSPTPAPGPAMFSLTLSSDSHGVVTGSPSGSVFEKGTSITVTSTPSAGSVFVDWKDSLGNVVSTSNPYTFEIQGTTVLRAEHASASGQYDITVNQPAQGGTITVNPAKEWYDPGENVTVSLSALPGYSMSGWTGGALVGKTLSQTVAVNSNLTIGATMVERWTILVHFAVDNNIDTSFETNYGTVSNYLATLESIKAADANNAIDIMLLLDGYSGSGNGFIDGYYKLTGGAFSSEIPVTTAGEINSGSVDDSEAFIDWAIANSNGLHFMYSVFNHGSGFADENQAGTYGIGFDDHSSDSLSHHELGQVTAYIKSKIGKNIDLFFPYACLMGGMELAWEVRSSVDTLLFSEEVFPAELWSYEALQSITSHPDITASGLGKAFCDNAYAYFSQPALDRSFTLAVIDLSKTQALYDALNGFAQAANTWIGNDSTRAKKLDFAASSALGMYESPFYVDIGTFMDAVDANVSNLSSKTAAVRNSVAAAVSYKRTFTAAAEQRTPDYGDACGISIFHNVWMYQRMASGPVMYSPSLYQTILAFGATNAWASYNQKMYSLATGGVLPKDAYENDGIADPVSNTLARGASQTHSFNEGMGGTDYDLMAVSLVAGQSYTFETSFATTPTYTLMVLCDTSLSALAFSNNMGWVFDPRSKLNYTPTASGTYYLVVFDGYQMNGDYKVSYNLGTWQAPTGSKVNPIRKLKMPAGDFLK